MNRETLAQEFEKEARADKIVLMSEFKEKADTLKAQELSAFEKVQVFLGKAKYPLFVMRVMYSTFTDPDFREAFERGSFEWAAPKPSQRKDAFFTGLLAAHSATMTGSTDLQEKIGKIELRAFDTCKDYREEAKAGKLVRKFR